MIIFNKKTLLISLAAGASALALSGCSLFGGGSTGDGNSEKPESQQATETTQAETTEAPLETEISGFESTGKVQIDDAKYFTIESFKGGYYVIDTQRGKTTQRVLVVPEGKEVPEGTGKDVIVVKQPVKNSRIDSNSLIALMESIQPDLVDSISLVASQKEDMNIDRVAKNMESGVTEYGGSAKDPDIELTKSKKPGLYISVPDLTTQEAYKKLTDAGINPFISFYHVEEEPFGRIEWVKVLGALFGNMEAADKFYKEQKDILSSVDKDKAENRTFVMFCLNKEANTAYVRKQDDVIAKIGNLAGGKNLMEGTESMGWERMPIDDFVKNFKDADCLIYMTGHGDDAKSLEDLKGISEKTGEMKAFTEDNVWRTSDDYLLMNNYGDMVKDLNLIFEEGIDAGDTDTFVNMAE